MTLFDDLQKECEWCGSDRHSSNACPTRNLVKLLTGKNINPNVPLPDVVVVTDENNLMSTIEEAHAFSHIKKEKTA
jgi:hypothetical protein